MRLKHFLSVFLTLLTLSVGQMWGATATFTPSASGGWTKTAGAQSGTVDDITVAVTSGVINSTETEMRFYSSATMTISGATITKIEFTHSGGTLSLKSGSPGNYDSSKKTWAGSGTSIQFTNNAQVKFSQIVVTYTASCNSLTMSTVTATSGDTRIDLSWPDVTNASSYTVTCKKKSDNSTTGISIGSIDGSGTKTCAITGLTNGVEYTWSVMPVGTGSYCAENTPAAGDATPNVNYTVTWNNNGVEYTTTQVVNGQKPVFPENPLSCDAGEGASTTFYGWTTSTWSGKKDDISAYTIYTKASDMPAVTGNGVVYNAVFCKGSAATWDKVTSAPSDWSGEYVITNSGGANAMISDFYSGTNGEFKSASVTISGSQITSTPTDKMIWVVERKGATGDDASKYSFKNKHTETYAEITASGSTNAALNASAVWFTITAASTSGVWKVNSVTNSGRCFSWYSSYSTFRTYANSSNTTGNLYKKNGGATSKYLTSCCTPLGTINGSFFGTTHFCALSPEKFRPERP